MKFFRKYKTIWYLVLVIGVFLWHLFPYLKLDFWCDEVYTLENFVFVPFRVIVTQYVPNNHVFFNIINYLYTRLLGIKSMEILLNSPYFIRLLPLFFSIIAVIFIHKVLKLLTEDETPGVIGAIIITTSLPFYNFAVQIRGYSLSLALLSVLLWGVIAAKKRGFNLKYAVVILFTTSLVLYTIPLNLYFILTLLLFFIGDGIKRQLHARKRVIAGYGVFIHILKENVSLAVSFCIMAGILVAAVLYLPVWREVLFNRYVITYHPFNFYTVLMLLPLTFHYFVSYNLIVLLVALLGYKKALQRKNKYLTEHTLPISLFMLFLFFGPYLMSFFRGDLPFQRVFLNTIIPYVILISIGIYIFVQEANVKHKDKVILFVFLLSLLSFKVSLVRRDRYLLQKLASEDPYIQNIFYNYYQKFYSPSKVIRKFLIYLREKYSYVDFLSDSMNYKIYMLPPEEIFREFCYSHLPIIFVYKVDECALGAYLKMYRLPFLHYHPVYLIELLRFFSSEQSDDACKGEDERFYVITRYPHEVVRWLERISGKKVGCKVVTDFYMYHKVVECRIVKRGKIFE